MNQKWEWRIFYKQGIFNLWEKIMEYSNHIRKLLEEAPIDDRPDLYLDLRLPEYGLKERWNRDKITNKFKPRLELKIRLQKDDQNKTELWIKPIKKQIEEQINKERGLNRSQIQNYLNQITDQLDQEICSSIQKVISNLDEVIPRRILVDKQRKQIRGYLDKKKDFWIFYPGEDRKNTPLENPYVVLIEQTKIRKIQLKNQKLKNIFTVCFEAENSLIIEKFKQIFIPQDLSIQGQIMSYPEYLTKIF